MFQCVMCTSKKRTYSNNRETFDNSPYKFPNYTRAARTQPILLIIIILITGAIGVLYVQFHPLQAKEIESEENFTTSSLSQLTASHNDLVQYALTEINVERTNHGLENVTLSPITSGQIHAENLLKLGCVSHWDGKGLKPYMRYTKAGGKGALGENCAGSWTSGIVDPFEAIEHLNWKMIYEDAESDWGHRDTLLNPKYNRVSIGIAYDYNNLFLVQDFEAYYIKEIDIAVSGSYVELDCILTIDNSVKQIGIFYDIYPSKLSVEQLENPPYDSGYDGGEYIGGVVPSGWILERGVTINADSWNDKKDGFSVSFDLDKAYNQKGKGIYTLQLWCSDQHYATYSIWYEG